LPVLLLELTYESDVYFHCTIVPCFNRVPVKTIFDCDIEGGCRAIALSHDARYLATLSAAEQQVSTCSQIYSNSFLLLIVTVFVFSV